MAKNDHLNDYWNKATKTLGRISMHVTRVLVFISSAQKQSFTFPEIVIWMEKVNFDALFESASFFHT